MVWKTKYFRKLAFNWFEGLIDFQFTFHRGNNLDVNCHWRYRYCKYILYTLNSKFLILNCLPNIIKIYWIFAFFFSSCVCIWYINILTYFAVLFFWNCYTDHFAMNLHQQWFLNESALTLLMMTNKTDILNYVLHPPCERHSFIHECFCCTWL